MRKGLASEAEMRGAGDAEFGRGYSLVSNAGSAGSRSDTASTSIAGGMAPG
jgi:hypothetical protein